MHYITKLKTFMKKSWRIVGVVIIIAGAFLFFFFRGNTTSAEKIAVTRGTVVQEVRVTGKTKAQENVDLAFEKGGIVRRVYAIVGDTVTAGARLAELAHGELSGTLTQTQAQYAGAQAKLDELKRGARPEDIRVKETELKKAEQDLSNEYQSSLDTLQDAYTKADDAVRVKTSGIFKGSKDSGYSVTFVSCDGQAESEASLLRLSLESTLAQWRKELDAFSTTVPPDTLEQGLVRANVILNDVKTFLKRTNDMLVTGCTVNDTRYDTYRTNVNTARTNIGTVLTSVNTLAQTIASQKITVARIQDELALKRVGATPEQLAAAEADVRRAEGQIAVVQAQIEATIIRAPFAGVITRQDAKVGEIAPPNTTLISLISAQRFAIDANVPEVDIGRIRIKNPVAITLDAFPGEHFSGSVTAVDPAETIIDGIANFKITVAFDNEVPNVKSGLTANLAIETMKKEGVLLLPQTAVLENGQGVFVQREENGTTRNVPITIGIRGKGGMVEVLSGVQEGEGVLRIASSASL